MPWSKLNHLWLSLIINAHTHAVPQFNITPGNIIVPENTPDSEVKVNISTRTPLARAVVVTVQTGPKNRATANATGIALLHVQIVHVPSQIHYAFSIVMQRILIMGTQQ